MAVTLLQGVSPEGDGERERTEDRNCCPICACLLNPGEKVCLDCLLDISIAGAG